ncbi:type II secretion system protein GspJ [Phycisphaerales bacterium AB-hyl4]|uniref:Type II secretion system protein J n=1 Tax=Natronomicrosphaera hydrolytica TaxID=3242702 RepID=A0ABV4TZG5_9BACT
MTLRARQTSAFTLIEVLLALSLSTLLIGAVYWSLAAAFDAHRRSERVVGPPRTAEVVLEQLRADLRGAVRPGGYLAAEFVSLDASVARGAGERALVFYTTAGTAGEARTAGVRRVEWALSQPSNELLADRPAVVRRVADNLLAPVVDEGYEQVLALEVVELTFRFYDGSQWEDDWDSTERGDALPWAVEVTLGLAEGLGGSGDGGYWVRRVMAVPGARAEDEGGGIRR